MNCIWYLIFHNCQYVFLDLLLINYMISLQDIHKKKKEEKFRLGSSTQCPQIESYLLSTISKIRMDNE